LKSSPYIFLTLCVYLQYNACTRSSSSSCWFKRKMWAPLRMDITDQAAMFYDVKDTKHFTFIPPQIHSSRVLPPSPIRPSPCLLPPSQGSSLLPHNDGPHDLKEFQYLISVQRNLFYRLLQNSESKA
jgi:hypothetical protein